MASKKPSGDLLDLLNQAIAREIQVSVQYMWQHVLWTGVKGFAVKDALKKTAISEKKHAEAIAERLNYLGGIPTTKPTPIFIGNTLREMLERDRKDEEEAIVMYKKIIEVARGQGGEKVRMTPPLVESVRSPALTMNCGPITCRASVTAQVR